MKWELPVLGVDSRLYDDDPNEPRYSTPIGLGKPLKSTGSGGGGEYVPVYCACEWVLTEYCGLDPPLQKICFELNILQRSYS